MNFETIRNKMEEEALQAKIPTSVSNSDKSKLPIHEIRRRMIIEVKMLLVASLVSIIIPFTIEIETLPKTIYLIAVILSIITNGQCMSKMSEFLKKTSEISGNTKDIVTNYIKELEITLSFYKYATFVSSLFIILAAVTINMRMPPLSEVLSKWISLNLSTPEILLFLILTLTAIAITYGLVLLNIRLVYMNELSKLRKIQSSLEN